MPYGGGDFDPNVPSGNAAKLGGETLDQVLHATKPASEISGFNDAVEDAIFDELTGTTGDDTRLPNSGDALNTIINKFLLCFRFLLGIVKNDQGTDKFLRGDGQYAVPPGNGGGYDSEVVLTTPLNNLDLEPTPFPFEEPAPTNTLRQGIARLTVYVAFLIGKLKFDGASNQFLAANGEYYAISSDGSDDAPTVGGASKNFLLNRQNHFGTQEASTISDFQSKVIEYAPPGGGAPNSNERLQSGESLSAAVARIGGVNKTILELDGAMPLTANLTISANIGARLNAGAYFTSANNSVLTIENGAGLDASVMQNIFRGNVEVRFTKSYPRRITPQWFGAVADGATDLLPVWNRLMKCMRVSFSTATVSPYAGGCEVYFPQGQYYSSDTLRIHTRIKVKGDGGLDLCKNQILFAPNKTGFLVDSYYTEPTQPVPYERDGNTTEIDGLFLAGQFQFAANCNATFNGLTLTAQGAGNSQLFQWRDGWQSGQMISINGMEWQISNSPDNTNVLQLRPYRLIANKTSGQTNKLDVSLLTSLPASMIGATIKIYLLDDSNRYTPIGALTRTITASSGQTWTLNDTVPNAGMLVEIISVPNHTAAIMLCNFHGVDCRTGSFVRNNFIRFFAGSGVYCADRNPSVQPETAPNTNNALIEFNKISYCKGSGFYAKGLNANNIEVHKNQSDYNDGCGIYCDSFLGNIYYNNHTSFNRQGAALGGYNGGNASVFNFHYSEGGEPPIKLSYNYKCLDGDIGCGYDFTERKFFVSVAGNTGAEVVNAVEAFNKSEFGFIRKSLGSAIYSNVLESFGESTDAEAVNSATGFSFHWRVANYGSSSSPRLHLQLVYGSPSQGVISGNVIFDLPCSSANGGGFGDAGQLLFQNGFLMRADNNVVKKIKLNNAGTGFDIISV